MLVIRMTRVGKKKQPTYRLVVQEKHRDPWGKAFEIVGHYNPRTKEKVLKEESIKDWIAKGAKPSPTVHNLLLAAKLIKGEKQSKAGKFVKPAGKKEEAAPEEKKAPEAGA